MASNAALIGSVTLALDASKLTASGQFTTDDGFSQSESVDLTALITGLGKQQVLALLGDIKGQYTAWRENTLPFAKYALQDLTYLSGVLGATVAADTSTSYVGSQSAKVTTPGAAAGEGVQLTLGAVGRGAAVTVTLVVNVPTGETLTLKLSDSANQTQTLTAVSPATTPPSYTQSNTPIAASASVAGTGAWQAVSVALTAGIANVPSLAATLETAAKGATVFWLGSVQVQA